MTTANERGYPVGSRLPESPGVSLPTRRRGLLQSVARSPIALLGFVILSVLVFVAISAPLLAPADPNHISVLERLQPPAFIPGGSMGHLLGTDSLGRDLFSRLIYGARVSLAVGVGSVLFGGSIGVALGLLSGFYGGIVDDAISFVAEMQLAFPTMLLAIALMAVLGAGLTNVILVLSIAGWVTYSRIIRGEVLSMRTQQFVEAAHAFGLSDLRIVFRHILPNIVSSAIIIGSFGVASAIISEAFLSFLGLGVGLDVPTWGGILSEGRSLLVEAWWIATFPGLTIMLAVLGINVLGDWLRDYLDPRLRI
jgi:peptide/nickel transport system permease protein